MLVLISTSVLVAPFPTRGAPGYARIAADRERLTLPNGLPFFVWGVNYEGPMDRAWRMWEDAQFDPGLIEQDFIRVKGLGLNTVRLFIQPVLRNDILGNNFRKLDLVIQIARTQGLYLLITFTDYVEPNLQAVQEVERRVAARYAGEAQILAWDLRNEPQFDLIALSIYDNPLPPLQTEGFIAQYGERISLAEIPAYRQTPEGRALVPARLTDQQAYIYVNAYRLYREFLDAAAAWAQSRPGKTTLDYMDAPESASWQAFLQAISDTLSRWIGQQRDTIRSVDPNHLITVAYSNIVLAKLPANRTLDFQAPHRFVPTGQDNFQRTIAVLENLRASFPGQPFVLEEFGYSNEAAIQPGVQPISQQVTANLEIGLWLYLYSQGYAGGMKWMLNNFPAGQNASQNSYGIYDDAGQPKVIARALQTLMPLMAGNPTPGTWSGPTPDQQGAIGFLYGGANTRFAGGTTAGPNPTLQYTAQGPATAFSIWRVGVDGQLDFWISAPASVGLNVRATLGSGALGGALILRVQGADGRWTNVPVSRDGDWARFQATGQALYRLIAPPPAMQRAPAAPGARYFPETGHNLSGRFRAYWESHGGLSIYGYPLSEEFQEGGYTVQYFERNRFEYHPEYGGSPYEVLLGRLGATLTEGRNFPPGAPLPPAPGRRYFPETRHNLGGGFYEVWNAQGGLAQFGYPLSEEFPEVNPQDGNVYTVQYFERARFEYHPDNPPGYKILLGLLGVTTLQNKGWLP